MSVWTWLQHGNNPISSTFGVQWQNKIYIKRAKALRFPRVKAKEKQWVKWPVKEIASNLKREIEADNNYRELIKGHTNGGFTCIWYICKDICRYVSTYVSAICSESHLKLEREQRRRL